jgi:FAD/FMN-containing dehydrogenase
MKGVVVDPSGETVTVQGGATYGDVDHATHAFGKATPSGVISTTGVGGLTLGGGIGHLSRKYGLSLDNLLSADVVLADGSLVKASADSEPDLFWALRGGGGNFGVVTSFTFKLSPVKNVLFGPIFYPLERTEEVLKAYRDFIPAAPEDLTAFFAFLTVPPAPPFPEALHMQKVCGIVVCYTGDPAEYDTLIAPMRALEPLMDGVMEVPFPAAQAAFDGLYPPKVDNWYWRALFIREIPDEAVAAHIEHGSKLPSWKSTMHLYPIDGAVRRVATEDTAFAYRDCTWAMTIVGVDEDPAKKDELRQWTVDYFDAIKPYSAGGSYVNMMMVEGQERIEAGYGPNYDRLRRVKAAYDPDNLFHVNQNIPPAAPPGIVPRVRPASEAGATARAT